MTRIGSKNDDPSAVFSLDELQTGAGSTSETLTTKETELAWRKRWEDITGEEKDAAATDLSTAQTLLQTLTAELVPLARKEFDLKFKLQEAEAAQAARQLATDELGTEYVAPVAEVQDADGNVTTAEVVEAAATGA